MVKKKMETPLSCSKCGSPYIYVTLNEIVCRKCGHRQVRREKK